MRSETQMELDLNPWRLTWDLAVSLREATSSALFSSERRESWEDRAKGKKAVVTGLEPSRYSNYNLKPPSSHQNPSVNKDCRESKINSYFSSTVGYAQECSGFSGLTFSCSTNNNS